MKKIITLIGLLLPFVCKAQEQITSTDDKAESYVIFNTPSPKHTAIENYDYAIELPNTGYKQTSSNLVTIFRNETDNATIVVKQYTSNSMATEDMTKYIMSDSLAKVNHYKINGTEARLLKVKKKEKLKQVLYFNEQLSGLTENPIAIEATCDAEDIRTANKFERSLLSLVYTGVKPKDSNVYETSAFSIANGGFKIQHTGLLSTIFTKSGDYENEHKQNCHVYFQILRQKGQVKKNQQKKDAILQVSNAYADKIKASKPKKTTINGIDGYEFDITLMDEETGNVQAKGYAVMLYTDKAQYLFFSNANMHIDNNIEKFKKIARTLKIK